MKRTMFVGWDPREVDAYTVARRSAKHYLSGHMPIAPLSLELLRGLGFYRRPTERRGAQLWDTISGAPMATEFAISRFLVPHIAGSEGWALFIDCDMMWRADPHELFELADDRYAVMCVKHSQVPIEETKMDGQLQTFYARKNWSSVMLMNLGHPGIRHRLTLDMVNTLPGRDLHRFCWLDDHEIGALPHEWNHLVGVDHRRDDAKLVHHTLGVPSMPGYENAEYADEWRGWVSAAIGGASAAEMMASKGGRPK